MPTATDVRHFEADAPAASPSDPFAFSPSEPFTIGVEEELLLVRDCDRLLDPRAAEIVTEIGQEPAVVHTDLYSALLELASPVRRTADGAVAELARLRSAAVACGAVLLGAGIHPVQPFGGVQHLDDERYRKIAGDMRGLVARTPTCALHVHVGLPDAATVIRVTNGMRDHLPLLQALSANSPFWHGVDSGLASARVALFRSAPRSEIPRAFTCWEDYVESASAVLTAGDLPDYTYLWWDVRPHPRLGTVEVRAMDAQSHPRAVAALAALVQALAAYEAQRPRRRWTPREVLMESSFRAARDGIDATLLHDGALRPVREIARAVVTEIRPLARELCIEDPLDEVHWLLETGGGARRHREVVAEQGMAGLLAHLVTETSGSTAAAIPHYIY